MILSDSDSLGFVSGGFFRGFANGTARGRSSRSPVQKPAFTFYWLKIRCSSGPWLAFRYPQI
jgi:hypothetical protein